MFSLEKSEVRYEPFPVCLARSVFPNDVYQDILNNWPETDLFLYMPKLGHKYSLSEVNNPHQYHAFIKSSDLWSRFHKWIKSEKFIRDIVRFLSERNIDLDLDGKMVVTNSLAPHIWSRMGEMVRGAALVGRRKVPLRSRFEFSMMPGDGGSIRPHTDAPGKLITLVLAIVQPGEWKAEYGGGTSILWPKDARRSFNLKNTYMEFNEMRKIYCYEFDENQCVVFVKTFNSWHAVEPISTPSPTMFRRSLTINIEIPKGW